jgi:hypothetical protein
MSVVVGQRAVKDTPANKMFYAVDKARELATHTIRICANPKVFDARYQIITQQIINTAMQIYSNAWEANHVFVRTNPSGSPNQDDWEGRRAYQRAAIRKCNILLSMIDLSKQLYHLRSRKVKFWAMMVVECRNDLMRWYAADQKRYGAKAKAEASTEYGPQDWHS